MLHSDFKCLYHWVWDHRLALANRFIVSEAVLIIQLLFIIWRVLSSEFYLVCDHSYYESDVFNAFWQVKTFLYSVLWFSFYLEDAYRLICIEFNH